MEGTLYILGNYNKIKTPFDDWIFHYVILHFLVNEATWLVRLK